MDILAHIPTGFSYVYQFENGKSQYRCVAAVLAMIGEFSAPGKWQNLSELMHEIYDHYAGPDLPSNHDGMTKEQCFDWLHGNNVPYMDLSPLVGDVNALHDELTAENRQGVAQLLTVSDESWLRYAKNGEKLHNWVDTGLHHCIFRVGFSDDQGYGLYMEPAAGLAFPHPVPILWDDIVKAGIMTAIAIMPHGVAAPPANFRFTQGQWPTPKPVFDAAKAETTIQAMSNALDTMNTQITQMFGAMKGVMGNLANDISALKQEV